MVENSKFVTVPSFPAEKDGLNKNIISMITFLNEPKSFQKLFYPTSNNEMIEHEQNTSSTEKLPLKRTIYVCTFCQVFSPSESAIAAHITSTHEISLPVGTRAKDFVSELQALQNENVKERKNKRGRPRKKESSSVVEEKAVVSEPVPGPDGLYWCQKCHRHFKKSRQLSRHVCLEITAENAFSCESAADSDTTSDFKTYMDIDSLHTPWLRRPKHNHKSYREESQSFIQSPSDETLYESDLPKSEDGPDKMKIYWRDDPNYVQLFENDAERYAFEEHLKSIDYSCVDSLFVKVQNKSKSFKKRNKSTKTTLYFCILCHKEFHSLFHIRMHCLTHTDAKPFTCPKCPFRSNTKGSLYTHMRNHTGKLFHCSKCAFKTIKRAHLLEHEQTHSSILQLCKLCKNTYKTVKSLIAHVHRYHNNPGGKKYAKFLSGKSSKASFIKCNICQKKFKTQTSFSTHTHTAASTLATTDASRENIQNAASVDHNQDQLPSMSDSNVEYTNEMQTLNDPPNQVVLNDILQQKNSEIYQNVLQHCPDPHIQTEPDGKHASGATTDASYENIQNTASVDHNQDQLSSMSDSNVEYTNEMQTLKDPLNVVVLNNILQQKNSEIYQNVLQHCPDPHIQTEPDGKHASGATTDASYKNIQNTASVDHNQDQLSSMSDSNVEYTNEMQTLKDPLNVVVLNNILQQKNSEIYQNVLQHFPDPHIQTEPDGEHASGVMSNTFTVESSSTELSQLDVDNQFKTSNTVLEECEKTLGIDLIKECLKDSSFADQVMAETCGQSPKLADDSGSFGLHELQMAYPNESIISPNITEHGNLSHLDSELDKNDSSDFVSAEPKSAETKLFEKCRQTPAYVCCVCSAIYVCPATLKIHLKDHINTNNSLVEPDNEDMVHAKLSDVDATIDSVCEMLEDSDNERELEKLYMSSLDLMYYLPEVSVLLENDSKFIDAVLDDFSNFPMSDKYDESEFTSEM